MIERLRRFADTGNAVRFFLSFVLAFAIWAWVTNENDPELSYRASQVPVTAIGVPDNLELVGTLQTVDVELQGPRSVIQTIDAASITAEVDLEGVDGPGTYEEEVRVNVPDGIRKVTTNPEVISVELDTVVSRTFAVEVLPPSDIPRSLAVTGMTVDPVEVVVTGVQRNVDRVERVLAPITIGEQTASFSEVVTPVAVDADNVEVEPIEIQPETVRVDVALEVRGREIPVFVQCDCDNVAEGYVVLGQPQASPANVIIDGPQDLLDQVPYIYTTTVSAAGLSETTIFPNVPLDVESLPDGVSVETQLVDVSIRIEQTAFPRTLEDLPIEVVGASPNTRVVVNPATLSVEITGPRDRLDQLEPRDVLIVVDVTGLEVGAHQVRPKAVLPAGITYSEELPQVVVAIIDTAPTPVPTATRPAVTTEPTPTPGP